jgi:hypothetical protein
MAYIDPSAGSILLQVMLAAIVSGVLTMRRWWGGFKRAVTATFGRIGIR